MNDKPINIKSALLSVYHKDGLDLIVEALKQRGVAIYSTGGTYTYLAEKGVQAIKVEELTSYPSILGGRVKTLHPKVFGGILGRRNLPTDLQDMATYQIPAFDLVVVDLYPFEATIASGATEEDAIEKIDIGGISLIRAAAKNFEHVLVIPSKNDYALLETILTRQNGTATYDQRRRMAVRGFAVSSHYDGMISSYLNSENQFQPDAIHLRYGENPHQEAVFSGDLNQVFSQLHGKELSYNNLVDIDSALEIVSDFDRPVFCIIKHTNPCGLATGDTALLAWTRALAGDPVSAFGGILATNTLIDAQAAAEIDKIFFEVCVAPGFDDEALELLKKKKNRILLKVKDWARPAKTEKSALNGLLIQSRDTKTETTEDLKYVTEQRPSNSQIDDLLFANKVVKHAKSNAIVLAKDGQLIGIGVGQTSRIDAMKQAIAKAMQYGFSTIGSVLASDAFFPFADSVEVAQQAGIAAIIQPGGSVRDQDSIDYCNKNRLPMVFTGYRHFKH